MTNLDQKRHVVEDVMRAVMTGETGSIAKRFYPGAQVLQRSNAGATDAPWFERMEGEFFLAGEEETGAFLQELLKRASYLSYEIRGLICEDDEAASRCDWSRRDDDTGTLVTGTTMYWFTFSSDNRIKSLETLGAIHSVLPRRRNPT
ncbi:nuclear transport factor 2 family protein [Fulvimarina sp. 2208YS6-2-32]|uniref:Nuclear transport factor 2 family protein n=1 Tax=Fulvimarina uroteuthidis TaxID=3098149 RepID=A0ABU5HZ89_9HYPH|nr:nuclear transport factor 2 family protein [Fulvimarina sp. 2208YS6-2-32]MDY8107873.1 nuclear transport factor 2 family protein [Fulvimarina sp. 2208YS6-2-32]